MEHEFEVGDIVAGPFHIRPKGYAQGRGRVEVVGEDWIEVEIFDGDRSSGGYYASELTSAPCMTYQGYEVIPVRERPAIL